MAKSTHNQDSVSHSFLDERITFDRFVRGLLLVLGAVGLYFLLNALSGVLWQFFVAWLLAYLIHPLVVFLEKKCHIRRRLLSISVALFLLTAVIATFIVLTVPSAIRQLGHLSDDMVHYATTYLSGTDIPRQIELFFANDFNHNTVVKLLKNDKVMDAIRITLNQSWSLVSGTMTIVWAVVDVMMVLLYIFFLLIDYEDVNQNWIKIVPSSHRTIAKHLASDIKREMNAYFRGQATVAFLVGVLFSIGFLIIDFPMAIGLGMFIGLLNMVPYAQAMGFIPTVVLALLKANDTGENFWFIICMAIVVFFVVQAIQDLFLVPKIMGKTMGLRPAIILLSLSVWGTLLGIMGFVIALPLTTLGWSYYRRFVLRESLSDDGK